MSVEDSIRLALETYRERGRQYGDTWSDVGKITAILYPDGVEIDTALGFSKFHILQWMIGKLVRFVRSNDPDSILDAGVYAFILESIVRDAEASDNLSNSSITSDEKTVCEPPPPQSS